MSNYCGGKENQWTNQHGKCGVCGDPYQGRVVKWELTETIPSIMFSKMTQDQEIMKMVARMQRVSSDELMNQVKW